MIRKCGYFLFFLVSLTDFSAQEIIPFRLTQHNNIVVKTLVNDKDSLDLMFQIAMEDASLSPARTRSASHIIFDENEISNGNSVKTGNLEFKNIRFFNNEYTGHEADGKIGTAIFKGKAFKIDYDRQQFEIYDELPDLNNYQKIPAFYHNGSLYIAADNVVKDRQNEAYFLLQSGYSGGLLYSNDFSDEHNLEQNLKTISEKILTNSAGQKVITKQGILPFLKIGNLILRDVSAGYFAGELKTQNTNYLGADILKRFNWIFDLEREAAYIQPSSHFDDEFYLMK